MSSKGLPHKIAGGGGANLEKGRVTSNLGRVLQGLTGEIAVGD